MCVERRTHGSEESRKRDVVGRLRGRKSLKKEIVDFYTCFGNYQRSYDFIWSAAEETIRTYLATPTVQAKLNGSHHTRQRKLNDLVNDIKTNLKTEDEKKRHLALGRQYGVTGTPIMETIIDDIKSNLKQEDFFQELISLKDRLITEGKAIIKELRKRMTF